MFDSSMVNEPSGFEPLKFYFIVKILFERGEAAPEEQFLLFSTIFYYLLLDFLVKTGTI